MGLHLRVRVHFHKRRRIEMRDRRRQALIADNEEGVVLVGQVRAYRPALRLVGLIERVVAFCWRYRRAGAVSEPRLRVAQRKPRPGRDRRVRRWVHGIKLRLLLLRLPRLLLPEAPAAAACSDQEKP